MARAILATKRDSASKVSADARATFCAFDFASFDGTSLTDGTFEVEVFVSRYSTDQPTYPAVRHLIGAVYRTGSGNLTMIGTDTTIQSKGSIGGTEPTVYLEVSGTIVRVSFWHGGDLGTFQWHCLMTVRGQQTT